MKFPRANRIAVASVLFSLTSIAVSTASAQGVAIGAAPPAPAPAVSTPVTAPVTASIPPAIPLAPMQIEFYRNPADQIRQTKLHTKNVIEISVLTSEEAEKLFLSFKQDARIPWNYKADGCYARAMAMAIIADKDQITVGKVFAYGNLSHNWQYHVAPIAYVNGTAAENLMVLDPALFPHPVPISSWNSVLDPQWRAHEKQGRFTWGRGSRFQYKPHGFMLMNYSKADLRDAEATLRKYRRHK